MGFLLYMDMLFRLNTNSTPLPSQLHTPLHSSLLAVGDCGTEDALGDCGAEGGLVGI